MQIKKPIIPVDYSNVFNSFPDKGLLIDPDTSTVIAANKVFLEKEKIPKNKAIGKKCYELIHRKYSLCNSLYEKCPIKELLKTGKMVKVEHIHYDKNNNPYYAEVMVSFVKGHPKGKKLILYICRADPLTEKIVHSADKKSKNYLIQLKDLIIKDPLTGVYNYRYLMERLPAEVYRAIRYKEPFSLLMIDIDYFKSINDTYGHKIGDRLLSDFARFIKRSLRKSDILARYAGEEFAILMTDTDKLGSELFANRLITRINGRNFNVEGIKIKVKISVGIAALSEGASCDSSYKLLGSVDKALQRAKDSGGNIAIVYSDLYKEKREHVHKINTYDEVSILKRKIKKLSQGVDRVVLESIYAFSKSLEARDFYTAEHAEEMVFLVLKMGKDIGLSGEMLNNLERGAMLHDIGKIGISDYLLRKKSKLNPEEYRIIQSHPKIGAEIIRAIHFLKDVVPIVLYHHERWDGSGYPSGLKEREIPLLARIVSVADAYQALISDRPYRKAYPKKEALDILRKESGAHFDKDLVEVLTRLETKKK